MVQFRYEAIAPSGEIVRGMLDAVDREEVVDRLLADGNTPVSAREIGKWETRIAFLLPQQETKPSAKGIAHFTERLATLLQAGVGLERALVVLGETIEERAQLRLVNSILASIRGGKNLTDAFIETGQFPEFYIALVRAGETSGAVAETMRQLATQLEQSRAFWGKVQSALVYPMLLMVLIAATLTLLFGFVLPQFEQIFDRAGADLPLPTRALLGFGQFLNGHWPAMVLGLLVLAFGARFAWSQPTVRIKIDGWLLTAPLTFGIVRSAALARMGRTLGLLVERRVPIGDALRLTASSTGNAALAEVLENAAAQVREGAELSASLSVTTLLPSLTLQLVRVGEETAKLPDMLLKLGGIYERETEEKLERVISVLVPLITIVMGAIVAGVIASVLAGVMAINDLAM